MGIIITVNAKSVQAITLLHDVNTSWGTIALGCSLLLQKHLIYYVVTHSHECLYTV